MARSTEELNTILQRTVQEASKRFEVTAAYLFGSYANGSATDESDIDIALFSPAADRMTLAARLDALVDIDIAVGAEVELHLFSNKCLTKARPSNIYGLILSEGRKIA